MNNKFAVTAALAAGAFMTLSVPAVAQSGGQAGSAGASSKSGGSNSGMSNSGGSNSGMSSSGMSNSSGKTSSADMRFVKTAAMGGMAEVALGKLATQKAQSDTVKQFGQRMVDDHTKANDQLKSIAASKSITLPDTLDPKDQALSDRLSGLSGASFDHAYMAAMVKDHEKDVSEFQKEASSGKDDQVKSFASTTLPTLQDHLRMAKEGASSTNSKGMSGSSASNSHSSGSGSGSSGSGSSGAGNSGSGGSGSGGSGSNPSTK